MHEPVLDRSESTVTTSPAPRQDDVSGGRIILAAAVLTGVAYAGLALAGDLRERLPLYLVVHAFLFLAMLAAWFGLRRQAGALGLILGAALVFRVIAALGPPALSDDVYRYVWDGRVQLHGVHPYAFAPADAELARLRDEHWSKINHPTLKTIYPPLAQVWFALLAGLGAGPLGFKLAAGLVDFAAVLALSLLLQRLALPRDRVVLYAWNPLVVVETSGSGHLEPLGTLLVLLATVWIISRRSRLSTLALGAAVHVKLLPALLIPGFLRRLNGREIVLLAAVIAGLLLPYAATGPALGGGVLDYAESWERNALVFAGVRGLLEWIDVGPPLKEGIAWVQSRVGEGTVDWDFLYRHVWPRDVAKLLLVSGLMVWMLYLARRSDLDAAREAFLILAAAIVISPTVHPWYLVWVLPFAAAYLSWPWLLFGLLIPLSYLAGAADVSGVVRAIEYGPPLLVAVALHLSRHRRGRLR